MKNEYRLHGGPLDGKLHVCDGRPEEIRGFDRPSNGGADLFGDPEDAMKIEIYRLHPYPVGNGRWLDLYFHSSMKLEERDAIATEIMNRFRKVHQS